MATVDELKINFDIQYTGDTMGVKNTSFDQFALLVFSHIDAAYIWTVLML